MQIILVLWTTQLLTIGLAWLAFGSSDLWQIGIVVAISMGIGVLASVWVSGTVRTERRLLRAHHREDLSRTAAEHQRELAHQRERYSDRLIEQAQSSARSRKRLLRTGLLAGGAAGVATTLVLVQSAILVTFAALLVLGTIAGFKMLDHGFRNPSRLLAVGPLATKAPGSRRLDGLRWLRKKTENRPSVAVPQESPETKETRKQLSP